MSGPPQSRLGDFVLLDCPHGPQLGIITTGSDYTLCDSRPWARLTDVVTCCACGDTGHIINGSFYRITDNLKSARIGDPTFGSCNPGCKSCPHSRTGKIITGSPYTFTL